MGMCLGPPTVSQLEAPWETWLVKVSGARLATLWEMPQSDARLEILSATELEKTLGTSWVASSVRRWATACARCMHQQYLRACFQTHPGKSDAPSCKHWCRRPNHT